MTLNPTKRLAPPLNFYMIVVRKMHMTPDGPTLACDTLFVEATDNLEAECKLKAWYEALDPDTKQTYTCGAGLCIIQNTEREVIR